MRCMLLASLALADEKIRNKHDGFYTHHGKDNFLFIMKLRYDVCFKNSFAVLFYSTYHGSIVS